MTTVRWFLRICTVIGVATVFTTVAVVGTVAMDQLIEWFRRWTRRPECIDLEAYRLEREREARRRN